MHPSLMGFRSNASHGKGWQGAMSLDVAMVIATNNGFSNSQRLNRIIVMQYRDLIFRSVTWWMLYNTLATAWSGEYPSPSGEVIQPAVEDLTSVRCQNEIWQSSKSTWKL